MWKLMTKCVAGPMNFFFRLADAIAMGTVKFVYILFSVVFVGVGIYLAVAFPSIPVLGKFSSVIFSSCGCFFGGVFLGKLTEKNKQHLEKVISEKKNNTADELQKAKKENEKLKLDYQDKIEQIQLKAQEKIVQLHKNNEDKEKQIRCLEERVNNLANSVICSFQFRPGMKLVLGTAKYKVLKYMTKCFDRVNAAKLHRTYVPQYREVYSETITQNWLAELDNLRFKISDGSTIEIYNGAPQIKAHFEDPESPMEGKIFKLKYNKENTTMDPEFPDEIIWEKDFDTTPYEAQIRAFRAEAKENLEKPFRNPNGDDELTKSLKDFSKQQLAQFFEEIFSMAGNYCCEIKEGEAPNGAIDWKMLTKEINMKRLEGIGFTRQEAQERLSLADNQGRNWLSQKSGKCR